jgi:hypothetical protein
MPGKLRLDGIVAQQGVEPINGGDKIGCVRGLEDGAQAISDLTQRAEVTSVRLLLPQRVSVEEATQPVERPQGIVVRPPRIGAVHQACRMLRIRSELHGSAPDDGFRTKGTGYRATFQYERPGQTVINESNRRDRRNIYPE